MEQDKRTFRPTHSIALKTAAVLLLTVTVLLTVLSGIGIGLSAVYGLYDGATDERIKSELTDDYLNALAGNVLYDYLYDPDTFTVTFSQDRPGIRYEIRDANGRLLAGNYDDGHYDVFSEDMVLMSFPSSVSRPPLWSESAATADGGSATVADREPATVAQAPSYGEVEEPSPFTVRLWANYDVLRDIRLVMYRVLHLLNAWKLTVIAVCAVSFLLSAALTVFLLCAAGRRRNNDTPTEGMLDKIPTDLFTLAVGLIEALLISLFMDGVVYELNDLFSLAVFVAVLLYIPFMLLLIGFFMSIATRVKVGRLLSNTVLWRVLYGLYRLGRRVFRGIGRFVRCIPSVWRIALCAVLVLTGNAVLGLLWGWDEPLLLLLLFLEPVVCGVLAVVYASSLRRVKDGISTIASGDMAARIDTDGLPPFCRSAANDLNHIGDGLSRAVDERMRSERFKTELITNVSHDIKTPLTSIINYVDLIKKMNLTDETVCAYVEVLDRQSTRLKKLTEDLVEASKAQSGVLAVNLTPCGLSVLLEQVEGEYAEKLAAKDLRLVVTRPKSELTISADGRHLGRIFDNLMGNILKYAQPGTRVYLDAKPEITPDGTSRAVITFRNTSGAELNIPAEELMERFVRGDASRHTEGSGLGLAIVRSLTELQGGDMTLAIDGDLFKVRLAFPLT